MKKLIFGTSMTLILMLSGCATGRSPVNPGLLITSVKGSESISSNELGSKSGTACATNLFGLFAFGDASIDKAAHKGGLTKASHVDYSTTSVLGFFAMSCTVVHGE